VGGQAATAAVGCARLGWRARYIGAIGDDIWGRRVRDQLGAERVELALVTKHDARTRRAFIGVSPDGERTVFFHRDPALDLTPADLPDRLATSTRILLVDATDPAASLRAARAARGAGVRTMVDADRPCDGIEALLGLIDAVILPASVVTALTGGDDLGRALARLGRDTGAWVVVATLGVEGALAWSDGGEIRAAAACGPVVDTTGAGDAFRAGFAAAWLGARPTGRLETLLKAANLVAGLNCRALGAQAGLPRAGEVPAGIRGPV
jgi:sugar/nucleoside kinase (ribokinase family)